MNTENKERKLIPRFALCLARSYDFIAVEKQYAHLVYSAYKFPLGEDFNSNKFSHQIQNYRNSFLNVNDFHINKKILNSDFYIFRLKSFDLSLDSDMKLGDRFIKETLIDPKNYNINYISEGVLEVSLPIMSLLCEKYIKKDQTYIFNLLETLIGNISDESKGYDTWLSKSIFIIEGFTTLFAVIQLFKLFNIHLSGGGIPSRIALSTIQANLHSFLLYSNNLLAFDNKLVFKSYEHIAFSKKVEKKQNNKYIKFTKDLDTIRNEHNLNIAYAELNNINIIYKFKILFLLNYVIGEMKKDLERYEYFKTLSSEKQQLINVRSSKELEIWHKEIFDAVLQFESWEDLIIKDINRDTLLTNDEFNKINNEINSLYPDYKTDNYLPSSITPLFTKRVRNFKKNIHNSLRRKINMPALTIEEE